MKKLNQLCDYSKDEVIMKVKTTPYQVVNLENRVSLVFGKAVLDKADDFDTLCKKWDERKWEYLIASSLVLLLERQEMKEEDFTEGLV